MSAWSLAQGDVVEVLSGFNDCSFDALFCDPPYGFSFMGKKWDYDVPSVETWRECLRVLKPGAPLLAFGGSRTFHRITVGIEDAGFEIRDVLMWLYAKGFPKSLNVSKAIDGKLRGILAETGYSGPAMQAAEQWAGYGTALKPAYEPVILARKPLDGTVAANVTRWGVGGLAIDASRVGMTLGNGLGGGVPVALDAGRWPANLLLDDAAGALLDASTAPTASIPYRANEASGAVLQLRQRAAGGYADAGGPSRFFYSAKVSTKEREAGCEALMLRSAGQVTEREDGSAGLDNPRAGAGRTGGARNHHPTLKPMSLTTYLARLIMPPVPGVILVPFAGAGSEMIGALKAGWPAVFGIEREAEYLEIARARLAHWCPEAEVAS